MAIPKVSPKMVQNFHPPLAVLVKGEIEEEGQSHAANQQSQRLTSPPRASRSAPLELSTHP